MKPNISFEIHLLSVDAGRDAVPSVSAFLAATSNPDDQHLDARGAEAVDFIVEQASPGASRPNTNAYVILAFDSGETRLLSDTARLDGIRHLLYATVFFPPRQGVRR